MRCEPDEVHVWRIKLDCPESVAALAGSLSCAEQQKAACFRSRRLRRRWIVAHGALRHILSRYAGTKPGSLSFEVGMNGKPDFSPPIHDVSFNLSHTGGVAVLAVASGKQIGIDAEIVRSGIDVENLSRRFFAAAETDQILGLPRALRLAAFFACWTRKEAVAKALGVGLSKPLDHFQVTVRSDEPARLVSIDGNYCDGWTLVDISESGIAAALATEGCAPAVRRFEFEGPFV